MSVTVDGIVITNQVQARALETQGFISAEELEKIIKDLPTGEINLRDLARARENNLHKTLPEKIIKFFRRERQ